MAKENSQGRPRMILRLMIQLAKKSVTRSACMAYSTMHTMIMPHTVVEPSMLTTEVLKLPEARARMMMAHREGKYTSTMDMP